MLIVCHDVFEGCRDTDIYVLDTSNIPDAAIKQKLEQANSGDWIEIGYNNNSIDFDDWDVATQAKGVQASSKLPAKIDKILTIYFEG